MDSTAPPDGNGSRKGFWARVFSLEHLAGDVRTALVGSSTGATIGLAAAAIGAALFAKASLDYTIYVNQDGVGQPKALFDLAEKEDAKLKLEFSPAEFRNVYVCQFKKVTGENYRSLLFQYLDAYRDCFDVSQRGENSFVVYPNRHSARLEQKKGSFLCECGQASR